LADIIVARATPPGGGAIGMIRLSGAGSRELCAAFLRPAPPERAREATLVRALDGENPLDQLVALWYPEGESYTGEESIELLCHASPYVLERLIEVCVAAGARRALPGEFTQRAYLNGRLDLAQAEAVCDLIAARTKEEHRAAIRNLEGGLSRRAGALRAGALALLARMEAALDHPDEDVAQLRGGELRAEAARLAAEARALAQAGARSRLAAAGARVAIVGRPNAGKSSLLNALLGRDRAIVAPEPGTTRDTLEEPVDLDGLRAVLVDTAGLREGCADAAEREGVSRARAALRGADLAVFVLDQTAPLNEARAALEEVRAQYLREQRPLLVALSKSDAASVRVAAADVGGGECREISSLTGFGIAELAGDIARLIAPTESSTGVAVNERQAAAVSACAEELEAASRESAPELSAACLSSALRALDAVVGGNAADDVLGEVFRRFCVGK
jgi:tRNA modification GTPase